MPKVIFSPEARREFLAIIDFISQDKPAAARKWAESVRDRLRRLATAPLIGERYLSLDCRRITLGSYVVYFRPLQKGVEIVRILHGSRYEP